MIANLNEYSEFLTFIESSDISQSMKPAVMEGCQAIYESALTESIISDIGSKIKDAINKVKQAKQVKNPEQAKEIKQDLNEYKEEANTLNQKIRNFSGKHKKALGLLTIGLYLAAGAANANAAEIHDVPNYDGVQAINQLDMGHNTVTLYDNGNVLIQTHDKIGSDFIVHPDGEVSYCDSDDAGEIGSIDARDGELRFGKEVNKGCHETAITSKHPQPDDFPRIIRTHEHYPGFDKAVAYAVTQQDHDPTHHHYSQYTQGLHTSYGIDGNQVDAGTYYNTRAEENAADSAQAALDSKIKRYTYGDRMKAIQDKIK